MSSIDNHPEKNVIRVQLTQNVILSELTATERTELEQLLTVVDCHKGDYLLHQGVHDMEQYIVLRAVKNLLDAKGMVLARSLAGEFLTVQEMGGFQMCIAKLDDELLELYDAPCDAPGLTVR